MKENFYIKFWNFLFLYLKFFISFEILKTECFNILKIFKFVEFEFFNMLKSWKLKKNIW
jgi:hypothetical protein